MRHGESAWNREGRLQGHGDVPLTEAGLRQGEMVARRLAGRGAAALYTSDLGRARDMAEKIGALAGLEPIPLLDLRELDVGRWQGLAWEEVSARWPRRLRAWVAGRPGAGPPGGETLGRLAARARRVMDGLSLRHPGETVLVVTHGGLIRVLIADMLRVSPGRRWGFRLDNGGMTVVEWGPGHRRLVCLNDTCHLAGPGEAGLAGRPGEYAGPG
ncbi:MAG: histidine phosphatase family protein [Acetobacteraceae bacterium]|nr:histidine phosphatase family protein [Acetobacteraceae bacterium]